MISEIINGTNKLKKHNQDVTLSRKGKLQRLLLKLKKKVFFLSKRL